MTWSARDTLPKPKRGKAASAPEPSTGTSVQRDPDKVPTYAQAHRHTLGAEDETQFRLSLDQERELAAEGIWPDRQWSIWKHAMTRGISSY